VFASSRRFWVTPGLRSRGVPLLEGGLVRGLVRVTLDDGGHRYSQREQLMSDDSPEQLTVPDDLHDERSIPDGLHLEPITHDDPIDCDYESSLSFDAESHDRLHRHTHLQPVAPGGVSC